MQRPKPRRGPSAIVAALVVLAIGSTGCGSGYVNAVHKAQSIQDQGSVAAQQAQQQVQSVENQSQQQPSPDQSGGYGY